VVRACVKEGRRGELPNPELSTSPCSLLPPESGGYQRSCPLSPSPRRRVIEGFSFFDLFLRWEIRLISPTIHNPLLPKPQHNLLLLITWLPSSSAHGLVPSSRQVRKFESVAICFFACVIARYYFRTREISLVDWLERVISQWNTTDRFLGPFLVLSACSSCYSLGSRP
jgi:hypothetical protein